MLKMKCHVEEYKVDSNKKMLSFFAAVNDNSNHLALSEGKEEE